jgi:hypothetical protein
MFLFQGPRTYLSVRLWQIEIRLTILTCACVAFVQCNLSLEDKLYHDSPFSSPSYGLSWSNSDFLKPRLIGFWFLLP